MEEADQARDRMFCGGIFRGRDSEGQIKIFPVTVPIEAERPRLELSEPGGRVFEAR